MEKKQNWKWKKSEIEEEEFKALQVINKLASAEENKGEWEIIGELIATELKTWNSKCAFQNSDAITRFRFKWQTNRAGN